MSYTIDAYRRRGKPYRSLLDFLLFVAFFPQLIAGPIVRADQFRDQLRSPGESGWRALDIGMRIALVGAILKVVMADSVGVHVDRLYAQVGEMTSLDALFAMYGFAFQVFGDFAGYSLIAIGLGRCFGFKLPQNFRTPYFSSTYREFWRRWHITLSTWLRDYLYFPLGGSRYGVLRTAIALGLTMLLGGLWHGASWSLVVWGGCLGLLLAIGRIVRAVVGKELIQEWETSRIGKLLGWFLTFHVHIGLLIIFRAHSMGDAVDMYVLLGQLPSDILNGASMHKQSYVMLPFLGLFVLYHILAFKKLPEDWVIKFKPIWAVLYLVLGWFAVEMFYIGKVNFIYFAF